MPERRTRFLQLKEPGQLEGSDGTSSDTSGEGNGPSGVIFIPFVIGLLLFILLRTYRNRRQSSTNTEQISVPAASKTPTPFRSDFRGHIVTAVDVSRPQRIGGVAVTPAVEWADTVVCGLTPYTQDSPPIASLIKDKDTTLSATSVLTLETRGSNSRCPVALALSEAADLARVDAL